LAEYKAILAAPETPSMDNDMIKFDRLFAEVAIAAESKYESKKADWAKKKEEEKKAKLDKSKNQKKYTDEFNAAMDVLKITPFAEVSFEEQKKTEAELRQTMTENLDAENSAYEVVSNQLAEAKKAMNDAGKHNGWMPYLLRVFEGPIKKGLGRINWKALYADISDCGPIDYHALARIPDQEEHTAMNKAALKEYIRDMVAAKLNSGMMTFFKGLNTLVSMFLLPTVIMMAISVIVEPLMLIPAAGVVLRMLFTGALAFIYAHLKPAIYSWMCELYTKIRGDIIDTIVDPIIDEILKKNSVEIQSRINNLKMDTIKSRIAQKLKKATGLLDPTPRLSSDPKEASDREDRLSQDRLGTSKAAVKATIDFAASHTDDLNTVPVSPGDNQLEDNPVPGPVPETTQRQNARPRGVRQQGLPVTVPMAPGKGRPIKRTQEFARRPKKANAAANALLVQIRKDAPAMKEEVSRVESERVQRNQESTRTLHLMLMETQ